uniref:Uncharacterized protein n=1 Tax=Avena sativa TaxID=4498 RepID=A0ACD5WKU3_AVESA
MSPVTLVHHALQRRVHNPPTPVISASHGAGLVVFASHMERELAVAHSPFLDPHHQVSFIRHDDTDNRFIYNHSDFAALSIEDYPMEHWNPYHIFHTAVSFANPCEINPICLSGVDYQSVLLTVKTAGLSAIPHSIAVVGFSGDENSSYFHLSATVRLQRNQINCLDADGVVVSSHDAMQAVLHNFFKNLVGTPRASFFSFDLFDLARHSSLTPSDAINLTAPLSLQEIKNALWDMDCNSSPGPDGFGPSFYKENWDLIKNDIHTLLNNLLFSSADLRRLNRSFLVLIPKCPGATDPAQFRPISLQNCCVKLGSKCLTNRLQPLIPKLISQDQTGFIRGRSISENFIYATDIVQSCFKRKKPAIVLKLDFQKAFDSISWDALDKILLAKGFPPLWCFWIKNLNSSSQSAVLLNASLELSDLQALVASVNLNDSVPDVRVARSDGRPLTTKTAYLAAFDHLQEVPFATTTWKNFATNRCRIFLWLADRDRLFTNERRFRRGIASSDSCPFCSSTESSVHLLLHCPSVLPFWIAVPALHDDVMSCFSLRDLWDGSSACQVRTSVIICALWNIWKRRNTKVFRNEVEPIHLVFRRCADNISLWSHRTKNPSHKSLAEDWAVRFYHLARNE